MGDAKPVTIDILVDGKPYGLKSWNNVPRKGDRIILANKKIARVDQVYWADAGRDSFAYDCWVQIVCKIIGELP